MMYGGDLRFAEFAHETMAQLATQCRKIASYSHNLTKSPVAENTVSQGWQAWIRAQLEIRLFYCAWVSVLHLIDLAFSKAENHGI